MTAGGIAVGASASKLLAAPLFERLAPAALGTTARNILRPLATAGTGLALGTVCGIIFPRQRAFCRNITIGGFVAAALDVLDGTVLPLLGVAPGGAAGYGDYIQLEGQAEVEAGEFGDYIQLEGQAEVEAGEFGQLDEATAATFGSTFG